MQKIILLMLLVLVVTVSQAQNRGAVTGTVSDGEESSPLEYATVAVVEPRDSSLISYTLTTKEGAFTLRNLPAEQPLKVIVSFVGYQNFRKTIQLQKGETLALGSIKLSKNNQLAEVTVTGERQPVVFKKDTIEFNVEAFKTRPNAVVEDLLKKLPGLQVDMDGTITVNGRKISKITVDGKDFFASDITVASRNIDVSLIDKVQIIDDREDDPDRLKSDAEVGKIINLKLKRAIKKSVFGKVYAGQGTRGRYETGGMLNMFRDTLQLSLIGYGNNVNRAAFSNSELNNLGGLGRSGTSTYEAGIDVGGRSWGLQRIGSGGFNLNYDIKKKLKANLMYFYNNTLNTHNGVSHTQQFIPPDNTLLTDGNSWQSRFNPRHNINGLVQWFVDTASHVRFLPKVSFNENSSTYGSNGLSWNKNGELVNESSNESNSSGSGLQYEHKLNYYRRFRKKDNSVNITNNMRINSQNSTGINIADYIKYVTENNERTILEQRHVQQEGVSEEATYSGNVDIYYRSPITKNLVSDLTLSTLYENNLQRLATRRYNPETERYEIFLAGQSSDMQRDQLTYRLRPGISWNITDKKVLRVAAILQRQDVFNTFKNIDRSLNQTYYNILPSINYSSGQFSLNYDMNMSQPDIGSIQPMEHDQGIRKYAGNPDLKPEKRHSFSVSYRKSLPERQIDFNYYSNLELQENSIVYANTTDREGATFSRPENVNGAYYSWNRFYVSKRFKKVHDFQARINGSLNLNTDRRNFILNNINDFQQQIGTGASAGFSLGWKELIQLEPNYTFTRSMNRYTISTDKNRSFYRQSINNMLRVSWPKKVTWEISQQWNYNSLVEGGLPKTTNLLNASLSLQMLKKDRGQLKLTGFDLLNQNRGIYSYVYNNNQSTVTQLVLRRYFMLTFQYNFNKTITK